MTGHFDSINRRLIDDLNRSRKEGLRDGAVVSTPGDRRDADDEPSPGPYSNDGGAADADAES
jgi:hypothetical protein